MDRWVYAHWGLVGVLTGDVLIHVEQVPVLGSHCCFAVAFNSGFKVEVYAVLQSSNTFALVDNCFRVSRGNISRNEIAESWVLALKVVVTFAVRNLAWGAGVIKCIRYPDTAIISEGL